MRCQPARPAVFGFDLRRELKTWEVAVNPGVEAGAVDDEIARRSECHLFLSCHYGLEGVLDLFQDAHVLDLMALRNHAGFRMSVQAELPMPNGSG